MKNIYTLHAFDKHAMVYISKEIDKLNNLTQALEKAKRQSSNKKQNIAILKNGKAYGYIEYPKHLKKFYIDWRELLFYKY